jgi:hypothetical protein
MFSSGKHRILNSWWSELGGPRDGRELGGALIFFLIKLSTEHSQIPSERDASQLGGELYQGAGALTVTTKQVRKQDNNTRQPRKGRRKFRAAF